MSGLSPLYQQIHDNVTRQVMIEVSQKINELLAKIKSLETQMKQTKAVTIPPAMQAAVDQLESIEELDEALEEMEDQVTGLQKNFRFMGA